MKPFLPRSWFLCALLCLIATQSPAFMPPTRALLPNFDKRTGAVQGDQVSAEQRAAIEKLRTSLPQATVDFHPLTGAPKFISSGETFLSGPNGVGKAVLPASVAAFAADPHRATKAFLREHSGLFGYGSEILDQASIKREFVAAHNGLKTVVWEQQVDGVTVFEAVFISHTTKKGELVNISSQFVPDPQGAADRGVPNRAAQLASPAISGARAVAIAAGNVGEEVNEANLSAQPAAGKASVAGGPEKRQQFKGPGLAGSAEAKLVWLPADKNRLRLCWEVVFTSRTRGEMFRVLVDVQTGEPLLRHCLTEYISDVTYRVYTSDSPSPFSPGLATPDTTQPPEVPSVLVTLPALDTNASPSGWIDDATIPAETRGNNVDAHTDWDNDNNPDLPRPQETSPRVFDYSMTLSTDDPTSYAPAAVVQLFYLCNWMHDKLYQLGFTEAAGNFQNDNFGRGGLGNDALQADAQDSAFATFPSFNNANMSTPPDGSPPRMQMYIFTGPSPRRDGDLDAEVVLHEYTHGLSNRRVGGGVGISALQTSGMGEGWSDFYALSLLSENGDDVNGNYAEGGYVTYQLGSPSFLQNYYFGIRRYPYTTDMSKNPLTFKDIDPGQISSHPGVPASPVVGGGGAAEVHNQGEIWCVTLWEARANLVNKYGWTNGNQLILQLVTDGMNLSPPNPTFLQARDAIIQADQVDNGGANRTNLWAAFAKRGMGFSASCPAASTTAGVREAFDLADDLWIRFGSGFTGDGFIGNGPVGGPFSPNSATFVLTNIGSSSFTWSLANTSSWLNVSPAGGTLTPGGSATSVTASLAPSATNLPMGIYSNTVWFTNLASHAGQKRPFTLRVAQPDFFTEIFDLATNDLAFKTLTFTPNGSSSFYAVCRGVATNFPADPTGGTTVSLTDDSFAQITLAGANTVSLYGRRTNVFFIGSNGYLTMNSGTNLYQESLAAHFSLPHISALFHDLDPGVQGTISWKQLTDRVAVTCQNVPQYGTTNSNNFQIEMFADGRIRLTYLAITCRNNLVGLSAGTGIPAGFFASDLDASSTCVPVPPYIVAQPSNQTARAGSNVAFSVTAFGSFPLSYQWRKGLTNLANDGRISGVTSASLSISNLAQADSGQYSVLVTNIGGSLLSSNATLLVSVLDHFAWQHIPSPQSARVPFVVTIQAQDSTNGTVTNFTGAVTLSASSNAIAITPSAASNFVQGVWTSSLLVTQAASSLVLQANDGIGHLGLANAIQIATAPRLDTEIYGDIILVLWPAGAPSLKLESSTDLSGWSPVPAPLQIGDQYVVPTEMDQPRRFFRLRYSAP